MNQMNLQSNCGANTSKLVGAQVISYNAVISACERSEQWELALQVLQDIGRRQIEAAWLEVSFWESKQRWVVCTLFRNLAGQVGARGSFLHTPMHSPRKGCARTNKGDYQDHKGQAEAMIFFMDPFVLFLNHWLEALLS